MLEEFLVVDEVGGRADIAAEGAGEGAVLCLLRDCLGECARRCAGLKGECCQSIDSLIP